MAIIRVEAKGIVFGYRPGLDDGANATVIVPTGTRGTLRDIGADGYRVVWDWGFLSLDCDEQKIEVREIDVSTDIAKDDLWVPAEIEIVSIADGPETAAKPEPVAADLFAPTADDDDLTDDEVERLADDRDDEGDLRWLMAQQQELLRGLVDAIGGFTRAIREGVKS